MVLLAISPRNFPTNMIRFYIKIKTLAAKTPDGKLYFSTTREGEPLHFQRKPYAAVFYSMGLLEFAKALEIFLKTGKKSPVPESVDEIRKEAAKYFDLLRQWMEGSNF